MKLEFAALSPSSINKVIDALLPLMSGNKLLVFDGLMGSGKTTLIKQLCLRLGVTDLVNSPTYSIVNTYKTKEGQIIYHFDFYRINSIEEAFDMGVEEYFYSGNLCFIEWAEKIHEILPAHYLKINISYNQESRNYSIEQI